MYLRLTLAIVAAVLFVLAGFTALNEAGGGLRMAYLWFSLALAASVLVIGLPSGPRRG